jgi:hypothetical protein
MNSGDPGQVLDVLRDVLIKHMDQPDSLNHYRIQSAVYIGHSGRLISDDNIIAGNDSPAGLRLTMRSGAEYDLLLRFASQEEETDE